MPDQRLADGSRFDVLRLPKVEIHATDVCNNRCTFCTTGWLNLEKESELRHPPRALIRDQLEAAFRDGARRVLFQGGEPTVRRDLGDLLADAYDIGYVATSIFTNARMAASRAGARWLAAMNVTWYQVSIQGGTAEAHDESVATRGAFEQTVAGTRRLLELGQRVKINAVLTRHLLDTLASFADLMIDLRPEEVGMDTVKPTSAFGADRETYARLMPKMSDYAAALRDAVVRMNEAGVVARLTAFAPCLAPGADAFCSEEIADVQTGTLAGDVVHKLAWKRSLTVKAEGCARCAANESCIGVYHPYAELHGLAELTPLAERRRPPPLVAPTARDRRAEETLLTRALRALFLAGGRAGGPSPRTGVRDLRLLEDGTHELLCVGPAGELRVRLAPRSDEPAYARTARFSVRYQQGDGQHPDTRLLDAVVATLRRAEAYLAMRAS